MICTHRVYNQDIVGTREKVQHTHRFWRGKDNTASCRQMGGGGVGGWIGNLR